VVDGGRLPLECGVWSGECGVWSVKSGVLYVWSVECEVWSVEGVWASNLDQAVVEEGDLGGESHLEIAVCAEIILHVTGSE
jgi:hypothetical protein